MQICTNYPIDAEYLELASHVNVMNVSVCVCVCVCVCVNRQTFSSVGSY